MTPSLSLALHLKLTPKMMEYISNRPFHELSGQDDGRPHHSGVFCIRGGVNNDFQLSPNISYLAVGFGDVFSIANTSHHSSNRSFLSRLPAQVLRGVFSHVAWCVSQAAWEVRVCSNTDNRLLCLDVNVTGRPVKGNDLPQLMNIDDEDTWPLSYRYEQPPPGLPFQRLQNQDRRACMLAHTCTTNVLLHHPWCRQRFKDPIA